MNRYFLFILLSITIFSLGQSFGADSSVSIESKSIYGMGYRVAEIYLDRPQYIDIKNEPQAKIRLIEPDNNIEPDNIENTSVHVFSDSDAVGYNINVLETDKNTGIFEGNVTLSFGVTTQNRIHVNDGDTLTAEFVDLTLPLDYEGPKEITATAFIGLLGIPSDTPPDLEPIDPLELWNQNDLIIDGAVIEKNPTGMNFPSKFEIKINEFFKDKHSFGLISAVSEFPIAIEKGDRALFYLKQRDGGYIISPYSVKTTRYCDARSLIQISPTLPNDNSFVRGVPVIPADWEDPCVSVYFPYDPDFFNFREPISPLKQLKHKIPLDKIRCYDDKVLLYKSRDDSPVCVKPLTATKLIERGWTKDNLNKNHSDKKIPADYDVPADFRVSSRSHGFILLDTQKNLYLPDMCDPPIQFKLDLSQQEKQQIWQSVKDNKFFELGGFGSEWCYPENCVRVQPEIVVTLNITANGKTHSVTHHNSYIKTKNDGYDKFENVVETIGKIVSQKNKLNNFTAPRCGLQ